MIGQIRPLDSRITRSRLKKLPSIPHIRTQLKESKDVQQSIRDVLVPRKTLKVPDDEGNYSLATPFRKLWEFRPEIFKKMSVAGIGWSSERTSQDKIWNWDSKRGTRQKEEGNEMDEWRIDFTRISKLRVWSLLTRLESGAPRRPFEDHLVSW